mmetsp:Transcript_31885/g.98482  ORF Transcript_31885/g.98482 Transcript_31885/m.98482 type:complete len:201 (+) Transcript_31885:247-849(+)
MRKNVSMETSEPTPIASARRRSRMAQTLAASILVVGRASSRDVMKSSYLQRPRRARAVVAAAAPRPALGTAHGSALGELDHVVSVVVDLSQELPERLVVYAEVARRALHHVEHGVRAHDGPHAARVLGQPVADHLELRERHVVLRLRGARFGSVTSSTYTVPTKAIGARELSAPRGSTTSVRRRSELSSLFTTRPDILIL